MRIVIFRNEYQNIIDIYYEFKFEYNVVGNIFFLFVLSLFLPLVAKILILCSSMGVIMTDETERLLRFSPFPFVAIRQYSALERV